jgi:TldD protein
MAQRVRGEGGVLDPKSLTVTDTPRLAGAVFRAWAGSRWVETAVSGFDDRALRGAEDGLLSQLPASESSSAPPGPSSTSVGAADSRPRRPMRDLGTEETVAWLRATFGTMMAVPTIKMGQAGLFWSEEERYYLNTAGANCYQRVDRVRPVVVPIAMENGRSEINFTDMGFQGGQEIMDRLDEATVRKCAEEARDMLKAKEAPHGALNVVLDPGVSGTFAHESFGHGTEADQFVRNRSYLQPLLGEMVGPPSLTIADDGAVPGAWGTIPFDDEGHPGQRTLLIDRGRFVGALHDRDTAFALGARPTGNTRRSDFLSRAFVRMTNTSVEPADWNFEEIVEEARDGIVLERWMSGMEDPLGGQMQIKVRKGHLIENGKVTDLVSSMAVSGSVLQFLRDIRAVGDGTVDHDVMAGYCGKGHGDYLPVGDGGTYVLSKALVGPG